MYVVLLELNCPVFAAENSTVPVMVPGPLAAKVPVPPTPMLPVMFPLLVFNVLAPVPSYNTAKSEALPRLNPVAIAGGLKTERTHKTRAPVNTFFKELKNTGALFSATKNSRKTSVRVG